MRQRGGENAQKTPDSLQRKNKKGQKSGGGFWGGETTGAPALTEQQAPALRLEHSTKPK